MSFLNTEKVLYHPERFSEWQTTGDTSAPITVKIDLTNVCNHDCPGCIDFDLIVNDNNQLKLELFDSLLPNLKKIGVKGINYTGGGEPTTHRDFDKIVKKTHEHGLEIGLISNGSRFHKFPMEEILHMFTWIRISLDAYDEETHKRTHGKKAKFKQAVDNIKLITDLKKKPLLGDCSRGCLSLAGCDTTIGVGYITNQHADMDRNLGKFMTTVRDLGVDYAQLRPSFGFFYDYKTISQEEWKNIFREMKKYETDSFKVFVDEKKFEKIFSGNTERTYSHCHAQSFKSTTISATGDVYICCSLSGRTEGRIGNIKEESFYDIWNGETRKKALEDLDVHKCPRLCVGDNLNEFLERFKNNKPTHENFL